mmetsp:Transcript_40370/g.94495  ORF Transcript_40370/g.94495 Transcript_40370/m.94495 type:complete len:237 (+) Transcript_40370:168-878(+)
MSVSVVTPAGDQLSIPCGEEGLEVSRLKSEISERSGLPPESQRIYDRLMPLSSLMQDGHVIKAGAVLHMTLPMTVVKQSKLGSPRKRIGLVVAANRIPLNRELCSQPAAKFGTGSLVETSRMRARLAQVAIERGYHDLGALIRACSTIRRYAMRRRAAKLSAAAQLQAAARHVAARIRWIQVIAVHKMQAFARRCSSRIRWTLECAVRIVQGAARCATQRHNASLDSLHLVPVQIT